MMSTRFPKKERLCSKKDIEVLFAAGTTVRHGTVSLKWIFRESRPTESVRQVLIVVPKRHVRKAVDRNKLKRQLREIYRLNKNFWETEVAASNKTLLLGVIYLGTSIADFEALLKNTEKAAEKFRNAVNLNGAKPHHAKTD